MQYHTTRVQEEIEHLRNLRANREREATNDNNIEQIETNIGGIKPANEDNSGVGVKEEEEARAVEKQTNIPPHKMGRGPKRPNKNKNNEP